MIAIFAILSTLTVLALAPVLIVVLSNFPGNGFQKIEAFISAYDGTLLSLGTLFLVSTLAVLAAHLGNRSAERRENYNRRIQAALQISKFRQEWISELRRELVAVQTIASDPSSSTFTAEDLSQRLNNIFLMLNPREDGTKELRASLAAIGREFRTTDDDQRQALIAKLDEVSHSILKAEWERLKTDLEAAHDLEV